MIHFLWRYLGFAQVSGDGSAAIDAVLSCVPVPVAPLTVLTSLSFCLLVRSLAAASAAEKPSSDCDENEYMSPTSLPATGSPWFISGSSVPPPPGQVNQHDIR